VNPELSQFIIYFWQDIMYFQWASSYATTACMHLLNIPNSLKYIYHCVYISAKAKNTVKGNVTKNYSNFCFPFDKPQNIFILQTTPCPQT